LEVPRLRWWNLS